MSLVRPTLYTTRLSANGRKVLAAALHLGLDPEVREVNVYRGEGRSPAYLAVHPLGKIPSLVEGELVLWESNAILQYLDAAHGAHALSSPDPAERADVARWLFFETGHWQPAWTGPLAPLVGHRLVPEAVPAPTRPPDWDDPALRPVLALAEAHLEARDFFACGRLTLADFSLAGMTTYLRAAAFPFERWPALAAWHARIEALPAWRATRAPLWEGAGTDGGSR